MINREPKETCRLRWTKDSLAFAIFFEQPNKAGARDKLSSDLEKKTNTVKE